MEIDRRTVLMSLVAGSTRLVGASSVAQESSGRPDPSLYIPQAHVVEERAFLHDFMDEFAFVDLITATPTLRITHIPSVLDRTKGRLGTVLGHISAQNPQRATFDGAHTAIIVFRGPHGYISPSWYSTQDSVVPTWNFGVVHVSGRPRAITDKSQAHELLATLIRKNERAVGSTGYNFAAQPEEYVSRMMQGISPFTMEIDAIEGKFKLGQERSAADRQGVLAHMRDGGYKERSLYQVTEAFYRSPPK
jgi:transcriptional regulator